MTDAHLELSPEHSAVLVVDVQERLAQAMPEPRLAALTRSARILLGAARELSVLALYTEQYPKGLGPTLPEVAAELASTKATRFEKLDFSAHGAVGQSAPGAAAANTTVGETLASTRSVVLLGMEAHVCVYLTARDLCERGFAVHVVADGVASRRDDHREVGLELCRRAGATITTSETVVFDWMVRAGGDTFKRISALVR
jgi:nicotinamidase-related amidase